MPRVVLPAEVLGVLDEDSALAEHLLASEPGAGSSLTVNLLGWQHQAEVDRLAEILDVE